MSLLTSCNSDGIVEKLIKTDSLELWVGYKNDIPIYQKAKNIYTGLIVQVDSIKNDSIFSYIDDKLYMKSKWKIEENGQYNYHGWALSYFDSSELFALEEIGDIFIPETQFLSVNQIYLLRNNKIDSSISRFFKINQLETGEHLIFLKSRDKGEMYKSSFLFGDNLDEIPIQELELNEGENILADHIELMPGVRYKIWTFYTEFINDTLDVDNSSNMYFDYNTKTIDESRRIDSLVQTFIKHEN